MVRPRHQLRRHRHYFLRFGKSFLPKSLHDVPNFGVLGFRGDMKAALQARDTNRLSVLRSLLAQTLNASKASNPIHTDLQLLALIRKTANASRIASAEFRDAGRLEL